VYFSSAPCTFYEFALLIKKLTDPNNKTKGSEHDIILFFLSLILG
jgi:hypothetical protein